MTIGVSASPVQPSHSLHPAAISTGVPSASPLHCFTLRPSIREFHQHALLVALPCRLQYGSSISTPFSLLHLAAFNMRVPSARPSHCFTLQPSTHFGYSNSILSGCLWPWLLYFPGLNNWRDVFHTPKSHECILILCVVLGHYEILACPLIPLPQGKTPHFHTFYCFACTIYAILSTHPKP